MADLTLETELRQNPAVATIAGLDEAGRGALAGPVVAAAVSLPLDQAQALEKLAPVNDSKQLTANQRDRMYDLVVEYALAYGVGQVSAAAIDQIGILPATRRAMIQALEAFAAPPDFLLIDGRVRLATLTIPQQSVIRGDSLSLSIAAASILAKVTRDRAMIALSDTYPQYGLAQHKGYGTKQHLTALETHGPTPIHRHSFAPIRQTLL